jgi:signal transduction histidine kinase
MLFDDAERPVDYRFVDANPAFVAQTGLVDAIGRTVRELVPAHESHWFEIYGRVALTGEPTRFEAPAAALGRHYSVYAFRLGAPERRHVAVLFSDVRGAKLAEAERARFVAQLTAERERLRLLIRHMPAPVALHTGPEHRFEILSNAFRTIAGGRDLTGMTPSEAYPEIVGQGIIERFDEVLATGRPWISPETHARFDRRGTGIEDSWFDIRYEPVRDPNGEVIGVLNFSLDVTDKVRARQAIEAARAESEDARAAAESANRAKSEFLAVMSHELRTPLNAIGGYAELLEMGIRGPITEAQRQDLVRIRASQRHLLGLIAGVLDYSRVEAGGVTYRLEQIPVVDAVREAESLVAPQLRAKGLRFSWAGAPDGLCVLADREKLQQVLLNLLGNAVKFTQPREGVAGEIEMSCSAIAGDDTAPSGRVAIRVRDTGQGIAADHLERIFEPFVQVDQRLTRPNEGVGLGLAISRDLARGMGGDLAAASTLGSGSTFTLTLPMASDGE